VIEVDDAFFDCECLFEKLFTAFVYNLLDFGDVRLISIDVSNSSFGDKRAGHQELENDSDNTPFQSLVLGTIFKPYYHLSLRDKVDMAAKFIDVGLDLIKEDETFFASSHRLAKETKVIQNAIAGSGIYVPNVTHYVQDYHLIEQLQNVGVKIVMVNFLVTGFRSVINLKRRFPELSVWGHRVGYWIIERFISMEALGTMAALAGFDFLHLGTPRDKVEATAKRELLSRLKVLKSSFVPVFTKTTPEVLVQILNEFRDVPIVLMACGYLRDESGELNWERVHEWVTVARHTCDYNEH
jgi:hypothetical protein